MNEPERNVQRLWHDQPREEHAMSIDDIRAKADRLQRKTWWSNLATGALFAVLIVVEAWQVSMPHELVERVGGNRDVVMQAVGWLAREDKLEIGETKRGKTLALKEVANVEG